MDTLLDQIPEDNGAMVIKVKSENIPPSQANGQKQRQSTAVYDPALVYILEFCTVLALRDEGTAELLGKRVVKAIQAILRDVPRYHPILIERATFYLFNLLQASYVSSALCSPFGDARLTLARSTTTSALQFSFMLSRASPTRRLSKPPVLCCAVSSFAPRSHVRCATR